MKIVRVAVRGRGQVTVALEVIILNILAYRWLNVQLCIAINLSFLVLHLYHILSIEEHFKKKEQVGANKSFNPSCINACVGSKNNQSICSVCLFNYSMLGAWLHTHPTPPLFCFTTVSPCWCFNIQRQPFTQMFRRWARSIICMVLYREGLQHQRKREKWSKEEC